MRIIPFKDPSGLYEQIVRHTSSSDVKGKTVLDIGCGSGWIETMLLEKGSKKIIGIDISDEVIRAAKKKKLKNVVYQKASAIDLPFKNNSFDVVVSFEVLEHIPVNTEDKMFKEVYRVLKPGGKFFLSTPHKHWFVEILDPAWWFASHRHYTKTHIASYLRKSGLKKQRLYVRGGVFTIFLFLSMYISKWITHRSPVFYKYLLTNSREEFKKDKGFTALFLEAVKPSKK